MKKADNLPIILFATQQDWEAWLEEHHETQGIWLKLAKKGTGIPSMNYDQALEGALCYGWIDGQKASFDEQHWLQRFTPRRAKSIWSKVNCEKVTALLAAGRLRPVGIQQMELAKADGRWDAAYDGQSKITVPEDFQQELDSHQEAKEFFESLNSTNRFAILFRIQTARKPETRAARIRRFIDMLANRQKLYP
jgi:uncharacterized protein YdeI (YjbR/CyaY-like superfamily)